MTMQILYERSLPHGPTVRIRRTSQVGIIPVTAVLYAAYWVNAAVSLPRWRRLAQANA